MRTVHFENHDDTDEFAIQVYTFDNGFTALVTNDFEDYDPEKWNFEVGLADTNMILVRHPLTTQHCVLDRSEVETRLNELEARPETEATAWYKWRTDYDNECQDADVLAVREIADAWDRAHELA